MIWDRLYELPDKSILYISREADEGWDYALFHRCSVGEYTLADGGYIDGLTADPIDSIASIAAQILEIPEPSKANLTFKEFQEYLKEIPDMTYRGVDIFLAPDLKKAGIEAIPTSLLTEIRHFIDRRLSQDILLSYEPIKGYTMHFIDPSQVTDQSFYLVPLPDTSGRLRAGDHVSLDEISEYDEYWARRLWLDPVYIERRGDKFYFDMD